MIGSICSAFCDAINALNSALFATTEQEVAQFAISAIGILESTEVPMKDAYYAGEVCKEAYSDARQEREDAIRVLECALKNMNDVGGCAKLCDIKAMIEEALEHVRLARRIFCKKGTYFEENPCDSSCSSSSSSCSSSSSSSSSGCSTSGCSSSSSDCSSSSSDCSSDSSDSSSDFSCSSDSALPGCSESSCSSSFSCESSSSC